MATLTNALGAQLEGNVRTGVSVIWFKRTGNGFGIQSAGHGDPQTRAVVLAVQPYVAAGLLEALDPMAANALAEIPAPPAAVAFHGYRTDDNWAAWFTCEMNPCGVLFALHVPDAWN